MPRLDRMKWQTSTNMATSTGMSMTREEIMEYQLDNIDIDVIERYLRKKKLQNINEASNL